MAETKLLKFEWQLPANNPRTLKVLELADEKSGFGDAYSDAELAAVTNYIISHFGGKFNGTALVCSSDTRHRRAQALGKVDGGGLQQGSMIVSDRSGLEDRAG
jgi:hypothetical protein